MSDTPISCPGCQSGMRPLSLESAQIDYCAFCGGSWFDAGEIAAVLGHPLPLTDSGRETKRPCPRCALQMSGANLGTVAVERCLRCSGVYLDAGELDQVAERKLSLGAKAASSTVALTGECVGCRQTFRLNDLMATPRGLACRNCVTGLEYMGANPVNARSGSSAGGGLAEMGIVTGLQATAQSEGMAGFAMALMHLLGF